ncbi:hypothetical protein COS21_00495 [bacterium (Candidatus Gribaldobacteria) CG02_land_8_20_14_3_00_41_15]|uniref:Uncharacterized protein n=1 Tax=bacterium (Candidatus Gribaldobacteria) CG02_land_8_20_14_3_00_41_15 TaxID=2014270 RepID=A0A2M7DER3_9BACT|nr:MAG: hypothetical protein COS21_00495 [bacterium (Candidatus Gribaldobacteria) CG02_land_8_20_14_3_00_41_15]
MKEGEYEYQETNLELECEICNTVADWENWKIADYLGFVLLQKNGEQRIFIQDIIFYAQIARRKLSYLGTPYSDV